ncbi:trace amine-associated receptor 8c-like [Rhopilema esculentum]|uniref:trace amine-associated receptor 8c-like n=1 Tax=Rhopilema esculentum TaxID=499914 RepID=UPI0031E1E257|eukprot:gene6876-12477_t
MSGNSSEMVFKMHLECSEIESIYKDPMWSIQTNAIIVGVLSSFLAITATAGNLIILIMFIRTPSLHNPSNTLIGSLCLCDLLIGSIFQPIFIIKYFLEAADVYVCTLTNITEYSFSTSSSIALLTITLISIDRYIAVCWPFIYQVRAESVKYLKILAVIWVVIFVFFLLGYQGVIKLDYIFMTAAIFCVLSIVLTIACYIAIYCAVLYQRRGVAAEIPAPLEGDEPVSAVPKQKEERSKSLTIGLIVIALFVCFLPHWLASVTLTQLGINPPIRYLYQMWCSLVAFANSTLNPIIYIYRNKTLKESTKEILRKGLLRRRNLVTNLQQ